MNSLDKREYDRLNLTGGPTAAAEFYWAVGQRDELAAYLERMDDAPSLTFYVRKWEHKHALHVEMPEDPAERLKIQELLKKAIRSPSQALLNPSEQDPFTRSLADARQLCDAFRKAATVDNKLKVSVDVKLDDESGRHIVAVTGEKAAENVAVMRVLAKALESMPKGNAAGFRFQAATRSRRAPR